MFASDLDFEEFIITHDPRQPAERFFASPEALAQVRAAYAPLAPIPWPKDFSPRPHAVSPKPPDSRKLPKADYLVVTWTVAEAVMLSNLLTPGLSLEDWYLYDRNWAGFAPKIKGPRAPSHDKQSRYYHKLGAYYLTEIGTARVLCFKSNLHLATDGPSLPLLALWQQIIEEVKPELVITTGTGGGVGSNMKLGDVVIAEDTVFDLTGTLKSKPYSHSSYPCTAVPKSSFGRVSNAMLSANADRLKPLQTSLPKLLHSGSAVPHPTIITTDIFAFDDTLNTYGLQGLGNMCEMDDATLGLVIDQQSLKTGWIAIRNASDPQIDGSLPPLDRKKEAARIYAMYGYWTTIGSVLASWAVIAELQ